MNEKHEILFCSCCLKPFNATKCIMGGGFGSKIENVCCPHCKHAHFLTILRNEQKELKKCLTKLKKTLDI